MNMTTAYMSQIFETYKLAFLFFAIAWPLALVPVLGEALQHFVEFKLGMFALEKGDVFSDEKQAIRLAFGGVKVLSLVFITLVLPRFFLNGRNRKGALAFTSEDFRALIIGAVVVIGFMLWVFWIGPLVLSVLIPSLSEIKALLFLLFTPFFAGIFFAKSVNNWIAGLWGLPRPTPTQHKEINKALYGGVGFLIQLLVILPGMSLHYLLGYKAMGETDGPLAFILSLDSIVVGILACLLACCYFVPIKNVYNRAV